MRSSPLPRGSMPPSSTRSSWKPPAASNRRRAGTVGGVSEFEKQTKVKLYQEIPQSLGDTWRIYASPSEGNLVFTGLTAVVDIRDQKQLVAANAKLSAPCCWPELGARRTQRRSAATADTIDQVRRAHHFQLDSAGHVHAFLAFVVHHRKRNGVRPVSAEREGLLGTGQRIRRSRWPT